MSLTFIDTNNIPRKEALGSGEFAEIINKQLCGAKDVVGTLRWLHQGEHFEARSDDHSHQLIYLLEGQGIIMLNGKDHQVEKGAGIYLGPSESARIEPKGSSSLKLFQLVVPKQPS
jgi:mannose-6-phosphate isomerase-like protein (cupin superfamily)